MSAVVQLARFAARVFYRLERVGPPLPAGPLILVANHPNAMLDPAVVWATAGRDLRFLAKSTLFRIPVLGSLMRRAGSIPVYRRKDPGVDPSRNVEAFAAVAEYLAEGAAICVFPEGISHSSGKLEPLRTGAARMALAAHDQGVRVAIVPVGLDFGRKAAFRSRATAIYGPPIEYADLLAARASDPQGAARALTERVAHALRERIVEADPESATLVVARIERLYRRARRLDDDPQERLRRRQIVAAGLERLRAADPAALADIRKRVWRYEAQLERFGLDDRDVKPLAGRAAVRRFVVREGLLAAILVPLALAASLLFAPPLVATAFLTRRQSALEMRATLTAGAGLVLHLAWIGALATLAARAWGSGAGIVAALGLPWLGLAGVAATEREIAALRAARSWLRARRIPEPARNSLAREREEIADVLERARAWLEEPEPGSAAALRDSARVE